jgi:cyclic-di-AMP phosphodiesterase PgpH
MLTRRTDRPARFTRRDALRLGVAAALLIAGLTVILVADDLPRGIDLAVGDVATTEVRAPRTIEFSSEVETEAARQAARNDVPPQYSFAADTTAAIARRQLDALAEAIGPLDGIFDLVLSPASRQIALGSQLVWLSEDARATLESLDAEQWSALAAEATRVLSLVQRTEIRDADLESVRATLTDRVAQSFPAAERALVAEIVSPFLAPNSSYSQELTDAAQAAAAAAVAPVRYDITQGEVLLRPGQRVGEVDLARLQAFGLTEAQLDVARIAGWFLLAALVVVLYLAWLFRFRQELWHRTSALVLLGLLLLITTLAYVLAGGRSILPFFIPGAAPPILVAVLLGGGPATTLAALLAIVAGAVNGLSLELAAYVFAGSLAGILVIRRGDRVSFFVRAGVAVLVANVAVISVFSLLSARDVTGILQLWGAAVASAALTAIVAVGTFQVIGNAFGFLTNFQLLELASPSQPLLRRLLLETPGTYHHSLMVGNLAERAAESIGADPLLVRVAAYYHDIGKLANPAAFIENQAGGSNIHDELTPEASAQVLRAHVPDGIDLAYRGRLPKPLIAFIPQHHGTARLSYFWAKAREQAAAPFGGLATPAGQAAAAMIDERRFRHAGPKPQSREAALLMLADGVEASVRSLESHDEATIRAMVRQIVDERLDDGQFDECDLTLRDLERTREAFVAQLLGMYHQRIAYPQNKIVELEARRPAEGGGG